MACWEFQAGRETRLRVISGDAVEGAGEGAVGEVGETLTGTERQTLSRRG